jgi:hypothetical protein
MELQRLNELLVYKPLTGEIFTKEPYRKLSPDPEELITIWDRVTQKRTKFKVGRLCWILGNNKKLRKNQKVLFRNLNSEDTRLVNLLVVTPAVFSKIQEAAKNLRGGLKILPHASDMYDFVVWHYNNRIYRKETFHDIITAQQRLHVLQLKAAKVLTKYCIFE